MTLFNFFQREDMPFPKAKEKARWDVIDAEVAVVLKEQGRIQHRVLQAGGQPIDFHPAVKLVSSKTDEVWLLTESFNFAQEFVYGLHCDGKGNVSVGRFDWYGIEERMTGRNPEIRCDGEFFYARKLPLSAWKAILERRYDEWQ